MPRLLAIILLAMAMNSQAADEPAAEPASESAARPAAQTPSQDLLPMPEQPDLPSRVESGQTMEPEVTIRHKGDETIEEYRVNNKLYMIKITPAIGPEYFMVDTDGDGQMDAKRSDIYRGDNGMNIPQWVLFSW